MNYNHPTIAPKAHQEVLVSYPGNDETVVYDLKTNKAHCLNAAAAFVWQRCDGTQSVRDIAQQFARHQQVAVDESVVWLALKQLDQARLLEERLKTNQLAGVSRRAVLRTLGIAAAVALPVVASLVVPEAVSAGSCRPKNATCTSGSQCCSGICVGGTCRGN
ncbi:MAG: PqqD family peptide modification chaperone [Acidobacteria bacterium]|nr:PqqD family peptide modification chaperone [Acidobacteriota bacterium]